MKMILAQDIKGGIGLNNSLPWHYPEDLKRLQKLTKGSIIIMGSKTFDSILEKTKGSLLKERIHIVLTNKQDTPFMLDEKNTAMAFSLNFKQIASQIEKMDNCWVLGGSQIYQLFLPYVKEIYLTLIKKEYSCDTFFPLISELPDFKRVEWEDREDFSFQKYERIEL